MTDAVKMAEIVFKLNHTAKYRSVTIGKYAIVGAGAIVTEMSVTMRLQLEFLQRL